MTRSAQGTACSATGTAGRIENAIVAVYASYATAHGHALVDRELYVQREWFTDPERMRRAGFDAGHAFATKGQIAREHPHRVIRCQPAAGGRLMFESAKGSSDRAT